MLYSNGVNDLDMGMKSLTGLKRFRKPSHSRTDKNVTVVKTIFEYSVARHYLYMIQNCVKTNVSGKCTV